LKIRSEGVPLSIHTHLGNLGDEKWAEDSVMFG
jgi:hypothetical protein